MPPSARAVEPQPAGFSLVELLVVISIISLLSTLSVVTLNVARLRARDTQRRADLRQVYTALQLYYDSQPTVTYPDMSDPAWWSALNPYLLTQPVDPKTKAAYTSLDNSGALQQFCIYGALEAEAGVIISTERGLRLRATVPELGLLANCYN